MPTILSLLQHGDQRTTGKVDQIVTEVLQKKSLIDELVEYLEFEDPAVRMRSADALAKVTHHQPENVQPFLPKLLTIAQYSSQQEVQWHLAEIFPLLELASEQRRRIIQIMISYLNLSQSSIVKTNALEALFMIAQQDDRYKDLAMTSIAEALKTGTPAMQARARQLIEQWDTVEWKVVFDEEEEKE